MNGLLYWSTHRATVGLIIKRGVVVDAPPYARRWVGRRVADLPPARESCFVTDDMHTPQAELDAEGVDWGDMAPGMADSVATWTPDDGAQAKASYPEYPSNPHNHRFTVSLSPGRDMPMMVVRAQTAQELTDSFSEIESTGVWHNIGAAYASMRAGMNLGQGLGPATPVSPQAPPPGLPAAPPGPQQTPPPFGPNVSVPGAPGYQGPPAAPQGGGWGGAPQGGQQGAGRGPKPRPAGWAACDVPWAQKDAFKNLRAQGTETGNYLRGKIQWGGGGTYWIDPSVAGWLAQQGYPVAQ